MNSSAQDLQLTRLLSLLLISLLAPWTAPLCTAPAFAGEPPAAAESASEPGPSSPEPGPIESLIGLARGQLSAFGFEKREAQVKGQTLVWWQSGTGAPVVMIHGVADQAATWLLVAPSLREGRQIFLLDLPGHGESEPTAGPLKMSAVLAGLESWLETYVGVTERPATLVGNSMGAWLASLIAHRHPAWVRKMVLINGGPIAPDTRGLDLRPRDREEARKLMASLRDPSFPQTPDAILDDLVARVEGGQVERMFAENDDLESHLLEGRLGEIETSAVLVWGTSDRFLGDDFPRRLLKGLPHAVLREVPKCGHIPQVECPTLLISALKEALEAAEP